MEELTIFNIASQKKCSNKDCTNPVKPLNEFPRNKAAKDGYGHWCKECHRNYRKSRPKMRVMQEDNELTGAQSISWKRN
jgi:hypothetical protein